jgi:cytoskeleton protein RodZ
MSDLGELLRQARVYKGASLRDAERATRISRTYLEALENQDFSKLPPPAYARGIVKNYAQYLGLDPIAILSLYDSLDDESVGETIQVIPATRPLDVRSHWAPNFAIIGFMLVVSAIVFAWLYSAYFQPEDFASEVASGPPTVTPIGESLLGTLILTPTSEPTDQAGGQEAEPTQEPTGDNPGNVPTDQPNVVEPTPEPVVEPPPEIVVEEPVDEPVVEAPDDSVVDETVVDSVVNPGGANEFVLVATEEVWLEVSLDWAVTPDFDGTLFAGQSIVLVGDVATVRSGNAGYLQVYVNGIAYGILSDTWNATVTLP